MNLSTRLDRLRARPSARAAPARAPCAPGRTADLARALDAECLQDGVLLCRRELHLPPAAVAGFDLTGLPEVHDLVAPDWLYIDTETTGLSGGAGNVAFMVGVARYLDPERVEVRQYVLGSFAAEPVMLRALLEWIGPETVPVSYNGKVFDLPLLATRLALHRVQADFAPSRQLDLMYGVRRAFRRLWPDCRLQTAEQRLLDHQRVNDLPGAQAPAAWQSWLQDAALWPVRRVLAHNYRDLVSLVLLHRRVSAVYAGDYGSACDQAAVGAAWLKAGRPELARRVWERAGRGLDEEGSLQLAALYRRQGDWTKAEALWMRLHAAGNTAAALELSKYHEHRRRDYPRALEFASACVPVERGARYARLQAKIGGGRQLSLWRGVSALIPQTG